MLTSGEWRPWSRLAGEAFLAPWLGCRCEAALARCRMWNGDLCGVDFRALRTGRNPGHRSERRTARDRSDAARRKQHGISRRRCDGVAVRAPAVRCRRHGACDLLRPGSRQGRRRRNGAGRSPGRIGRSLCVGCALGGGFPFDPIWQEIRAAGGTPLLPPNPSSGSLEALREPCGPLPGSKRSRPARSWWSGRFRPSRIDAGRRARSLGACVHRWRGCPRRTATRSRRGFAFASPRTLWGESPGKRAPTR